MNKKILLILNILLLGIFSANAQCVNGTPYPTAAVSLDEGNLVTISTLNYLEEYSEISGIIAGETYQFTVTESGFITVYQDGVSATYLGAGVSSVDVVSLSSGNLFVHWTEDAACNTTTGFVTTTVQWLSWTPPSCPVPTSLVYEGISTDTTSVSWTTGGASQWVIEFGTANFVQGTGTTVVTTDNPYTFTGLNADTEYSFFLRDYCGSGDSSFWVGRNTFTTLPTCPISTDLAYVGISSDTMSFSWTTGGASQWIIEYDTANFVQGTGTTVVTSDNPYTFTGLTADTEYFFYLRDYCAAGDSSLWDGPYAFSTNPIAPATAMGVACTTPGALNSIIFSENFEDNTAGWTGDVGTANGDWGIPDAGTSTNTGPSDGYLGGSYMKFEASNTATNQGSVVSPEIDLTSVTDAAELSFWMHAYGLTMGTLEVGVGTSATGPFTTEFTWVGDFQTYAAQPWINVGVDLTAYVGQSIYIQFTQIDDNNSAGGSFGYDGDMSIDLFEVSACVGCATPEVDSTSSITATSANLYWTTGGSTDWIVEYGAVGFDHGAGTEVLVSGDDSLILSGLTPASSYDWYVRDYCGVADSSAWSSVNTFTTLCNPITTFPWTEDFEGVTTPELPICWSILNGGSADFFKTWTTYGVSSSKAAGLYTDYNGGDNDDYLIMPQFTLTGNERLSFSVRSRSTGEPNDYKVVLSTTGTNPADFNIDLMPLTTVSNTTHTAITPIDLSAYTGDVYIAIYVPNGGLDGYYIYFDDFVVEKIPTCFEPTALTSNVLSPSEADLLWTTGGATDWIVEYGEAGFVQGAGTEVVVSGDDSLNVTGLDANTTYDWYVRDFCAAEDSSAWSSVNTFTTECGVYTPYYIEDFASFVPDCWEEAGSGDISTGPSDFGAADWGSSSLLSSNSAKVNLYSNVGEEWLLSPNFDLSVGGYEVVLDVAVTNYASSGTDVMGSDDYVTLAYTEDGITWTAINTWTAADNLSNSLTTLNFPLVSIGTNVRFGILASDGSVDDSEDYDFHITNFIVRTPPTCPEPSSFTVSNVTNISATLDWVTGGATDWIVEYGEAGFVQGAGTEVVVSGDDSLNISGLDANTTYDWYVRDFCAAGDSSLWSSVNTFTTLCNSITTFPWTEDFEGVTTPELPSCWSIFDGGSSDFFISYTTYGSAGSKAAGLYTDFNSGDNDDYLIMPQFTLTGNERLSFSVRSRSTGEPNDYKVVLSTTGNDPADFNVELMPLTTVSNTTHTAITPIDLSAYTGDVYIAIYVPNGGLDGYYIYFDDFVVCAPVVNAVPVAKTICDGDSLELSNGTFVKVAGSVNDTLIAVSSCDSVVTYDVTILMPSSSAETETVCEGDEYDFYGQTLTTAGTYTHVLPNAVGCDSTITMTFVVTAASSTSEVEAICDGDTYDFYGTSLTMAGTYYDSLTNAAGCDSVITLDLTVHVATTATENESICNGVAYDFYGTSLTTAGTYNHTLTNSMGCDSVLITLNLSENMATTSTEAEEICDGGSYDFYGTSLTTAGTYTHVLPNAAGCDSTITMTFTVNMPSASSEVEEICDGGSYDFYGQTLTTAGTYTHVLPNAVGCDSTITMTFTVNMPSASSEVEEICDGGSYDFYGQTLTATGTYTHVLPNAVGCDSTITMTFTVNVPTASSESESICDGGSYDFYGQTLTTANTYTHVLPNAAGCDSTITMTFTVRMPTASSESEIICEDDSYDFYGTPVTTAGAYTHVLPNAEGCDSTITLDLTVLAKSSSDESQVVCEGESYDFYGQALTATGTYTHVLPNAEGCDSTITMDFTVNMPTTSSQDVVLSNDNPSFELADGTKVEKPGTYTAETVGSNGCTETITYNVSSVVGIFDIANNVAMTVYPNPAIEVLNVVFSEKLTDVNNITVVNVLGQDVYSMSNLDETSLTINTSSLTSGIYYLHVTSNNKVSVKSFTVAK